MVLSGLAVRSALQLLFALAQLVPAQIGCNAAHIALQKSRTADQSIDVIADSSSSFHSHRKLHQVPAPVTLPLLK